MQTCSAGEEDDGARWAWPLMGQVRLLCEPISRIRILTSGLRDELGRALGPRAVHRGVPHSRDRRPVGRSSRHPESEWEPGGAETHRTQKEPEPEAKTPSPAKPLNPSPLPPP